VIEVSKKFVIALELDEDEARKLRDDLSSVTGKPSGTTVALVELLNKNLRRKDAGIVGPAFR
jgi:hypothetical protein